MDITLRPATPDDDARLAAWADRPDSPLAAGAARVTEIIARDGAPVGQISFHRDKHEHEDGYSIDIFVEPAHRRAGVARAAMVAFLAAHARDHAGGAYLAVVDAGNDAARAFFAMLGFTFEKQDAARVHYRRQALPADADGLPSLFGRAPRG